MRKGLERREERTETPGQKQSVSPFMGYVIIGKERMNTTNGFADLYNLHLTIFILGICIKVPGFHNFTMGLLIIRCTSIHVTTHHVSFTIDNGPDTAVFRHVDPSVIIWCGRVKNLTCDDTLMNLTCDHTVMNRTCDDTLMNLTCDHTVMNRTCDHTVMNLTCDHTVMNLTCDHTVMNR